MRDVNVQGTNYLDANSTLNEKKLFRVDPYTSQPIGKPVRHKKSNYIQCNINFRAHIYSTFV